MCARPRRIVPKLAKTVSAPIGTPEEQAIDGWRAFGIRRLASMSARERIVEAPSPILAIVDERASNLERPLLGVTTDGTVRTGLRSLGGRKVDTRPIADAASAFLQALNRDQRAQATFPMDADGMADVDQRPHEPLPTRRHARGLGAAGARSRARHRSGHDVDAWVPPCPIDHARQRVDR